MAGNPTEPASTLTKHGWLLLTISMGDSEQTGCQRINLCVLRAVEWPPSAALSGGKTGQWQHFQALYPHTFKPSRNEKGFLSQRLQQDTLSLSLALVW